MKWYRTDSLEAKPSGDMVTRAFQGIENQSHAEADFDMQLSQPDWIIKAHNTRSGRIFMFGSGPSLAKQRDLMPLMQEEQTWTVNRFGKWKPPFIPTHHSVAEPAPIMGDGKYVLPQYDFPKAQNRIAVSWWPVIAPGWLWVAKATDEIQMRWEGFQGLGEYLPPIATGWASPLTCSQVAAWLGYTEFYFLGIDTTQVGQAWDVETGRTTFPRSIRSICDSFARARAEIEKAGRTIIDCTPGGLINQEGILEYRDLAEVLHDKPV